MGNLYDLIAFNTAYLRLRAFVGTKVKCQLKNNVYKIKYVVANVQRKPILILFKRIFISQTLIQAICN